MSNKSFGRLPEYLGTATLVISISYFFFSHSQTHFYEDIYFANLCEDSGEYIYKTIGEVASIYQMRLPEKYKPTKPPALYVTDPTKPYLSHWTGEHPYWDFSNDPWTAEYPFNFPPPKTRTSIQPEAEEPFTNYFFEGNAQSGDQNSSRLISITSEFVQSKKCGLNKNSCYFGLFEHRFNTKEIDKIKSRYGYTWEQISPKYFTDRIVGAQWKIVDLNTGEVIAEARDYILFPRTHIIGGMHTRYKDSGGTCKQMFNDANDPTPPFMNVRNFVTSVLNPPIVRKPTFKALSEN